jgi:hypothetical protein
MLLTEDKDMIQAISADRADEPFGVSILPGRPSRNRLIPYAHGSKTPDEGTPVRAIAITNDILWRFAPTARFG